MSTVNFHVSHHTLPCQHIRHYPRATVDGDNDELHLRINQYTPRDNSKPQPGDVTFIAAHANGVGKELYEPLWNDLYELTKRTGSFKIRSIWIADVAHQGESGVVNEKILGNDPSWFDHPRDLLHMINHFRHQMTRPLIGVGHSMGGNNIVNLSLMHPRLFHGVILVDPVIQRHVSPQGNYGVAYLSTFRRDVWPSQSEAETSMRKNKFYQTWDPRALELWFRHGLRELPTTTYPAYPPTTSKASRSQALISAAASSAAPTTSSSPTDKPVTLTTTKAQEVFSFLRPAYPAPGILFSSYKPPRTSHPDIPTLPGPQAPFYRPEAFITYHNLQFLRPHCLYVFPTDSVFFTDEFRSDKLELTGTGVGGSGGVTEGAVSEIVIEDAGHFVPFEKPGQLAQQMVVWLDVQLARWAAEEEAERREWAAVPPEEKSKISKAWEYWIKGDLKALMDGDKARENALRNTAVGGSKL